YSSLFLRFSFPTRRSSDLSMFQTLIMGFINVVFTVIAIMTVDRWGRKPLLITGSIGMAIGMIAIALLSFLDIIGIGTLVFIIILDRKSTRLNFSHVSISFA